MSSNKSAERLVVRIRPSRGLALYLALLHVSTAAALTFGLQGRATAMLAISLLVLSACWHWRALAGFSDHGKTAGVLLAGDGTWHLESASGRCVLASSNPFYFIGLSVIVLVWPGTGLRACALVLFPDSECPEVLRRLRVVLTAGEAK